ncbi:MAG TPA: PilT/PilU family type 4a pilus ATPase [Patescibacteria group bacterium]|nr:PilT/PilU family type 4a pilus ATPase [Patescibacteria group bacterium]
MSQSKLLQWLIEMVQRKSSDLYITFGSPPMLRGDNGVEPADSTALDDAAIAGVIADFTTNQQRADFERDCELNMALDLGEMGRFRVNIFKQRQHSGLVIRQITTQIPSFEQLRLPTLLGELCCEKRGLVIVVGATGSGKSTSLAAMIDYRNAKDVGHIITIEDPIEYVHEHKRCLVTQREVGIDTHSFEAALKNSLRQKPDVILIGEIRDATTMEYAMNIAETGHLCLATLHANNANQAIDRILSFYDRDVHAQVQMNLAMNLRGIMSQRLVRTVSGGRVAALEIMLNQGLVKELIRKGEVKEIKPVMASNQSSGMQTFDQALLALWKTGEIAEEVALAEADNAADLKMSIQREKMGGAEGLKGVDTSALALD